MAVLMAEDNSLVLYRSVIRWTDFRFPGCEELYILFGICFVQLKMFAD